jgi:glycosyltransferase involved in cell wall biosynthesis
MDNGRQRMISYIVPAYNEERFLGATLHALHAASAVIGEPYEIVVADDASSDATAAVATRCGARVVRVAHRQIAATRNSGARAALGNRLIFVDADTQVDAVVIHAALQALRDGAAGGGAAVRFDGRVPAYASVLLVAVVWLFRVCGWAAGCFVFCTRPAFEGAGGFDETLYAAEEIAMSAALKRQGRFVVLRQAVTTSGRRIRAYSAWELFRTVAQIAVGGARAMRTRRGVAIWYEERRNDPDN